MLSLIFKILRAFILITTLVGLQILVQSLLPAPYQTLNILLAVIGAQLAVKSDGRMVWLAFSVLTLLGLVAADNFYLPLIAGTLATLISIWLSRHILSGQSWYSALTITFILIFLFRFIYLFILLITSSAANLFSQTIFIFFGWEMLFTIILSQILYYFITRRFV